MHSPEEQPGRIAINSRWMMATVLLAISIMLTIVLLAEGSDAETEEWLDIQWKDPTNVKFQQRQKADKFEFNITYTGNRSAVGVVLELEKVPTTWMVWFTSEHDGIRLEGEPYRYERNKTYNGSLTFMPPIYAVNGTYWISLVIYIHDDRFVSFEYTRRVIIEQYADFEVTRANPPHDGEFPVLPKATLTFRFALYNLGNGDDTFMIQVDLLGEGSYWEMVVGSGVDERGRTPLVPSDIRRVNPYHIEVRITQLPEARAHVTAHVVINATSMFNTSIDKPPAFAVVTAFQHYQFEVNDKGSSITIDSPGGEVEFKIRIHNSGNGWDTFSIHPVWDTEANPGFIAAIQPRTVDVDGNDTEEVSLIIKVPSMPSRGAYIFHAEIESASPELAPVTMTFVVHVGQFFHFEVSTIRDTITVVPGDEAQFLVTVKNTGNDMDTIILQGPKGLPEGWGSYIQPEEASILQDQEAVFNLIVQVPSIFEMATIGTYPITLTVASTRSDASEEIQLTIEVEQLFQIEWNHDYLNLRPTRRFNPYEVDVIAMTVEIMNRGSGTDGISLSASFDSPLLTISFTPEWTRLAPGESKEIGVKLQVEKEIPPGLYNYTVTAVSTEAGYLLAQNITVPFQIDNVDVRVPSIPTFIDPNCGDVMRGELSITPGTDMYFKIKVENNGTLPTGPVLVRVFDNYVVDGRQVRWNFFNFTTPSIDVGDRYIVGERPFTPSNPPLFWPTDVSADHRLEFRVFLDHQSNTENDVAYFNVSVEAKNPHPDDRDRSLAPYLDIWIFTMVLVAIHITIASILMMPPARLRYRRLWRDRWSRR